MAFFNTEYTIEYKGVKFILKDSGIDAIIKHLKDSKEDASGYIEASLNFFYSNLVRIEGLEYNGEKIETPQRFKELNPDAHDVLKIIKAFNNGIINLFGGDDKDVNFSKNA